MISKGFTSSNRLNVFKTLPHNFFTEIEQTLSEDQSPDKSKSLKIVLPKIRQEIHQVSERHAYKLLYPLALLESHN